MPDTGEDREIKDRVNANEAEVIRESNALARKVKGHLNTAKRAPVNRPGRKDSKRKK